MLKFILLTSICFISSFSYELPKIELDTSKKPKIVLFKATSVVTEEKRSYEIKWKTINADSVQLTYIGRVKALGSILITEGEYNRGPITLTASSDKGSDSKTINIQKNRNEPIVILKTKEQKVTTQQYYNTMPYPRRYNRPFRRYY